MIYPTTRIINTPISDDLNIFGQYDPEAQAKFEEYANYIREHIKNVSDVFDKKYAMINEFLQSYAKGYTVDDVCQALAYRIRSHDESKMSFEEFKYYRVKYYPTKIEDEVIKKYQEQQEQIEDYCNTAWIHHAHHNDHHPEYWITRDHDGKQWKDIFAPMPILAVIEMLIDWEAMGIKFGGTAAKYYAEHKNEKPLHRKTIKTIESLLYIFE